MIKLAEDRPAKSSDASRVFSRFFFPAFLVCAALYFARALIEPIAFALVGVALVWPIQKALERRTSKNIALFITITLTLFLILALASAIVWSVGDVVHWIIANVSRFHSAYTQASQWLEGRGIFITDGIQKYDAGYFVEFLQEIVLQLNYFVGFSIVVFVLLTFGLAEIVHYGSRFDDLAHRTGWDIHAISDDISKKIRKYMLIRSAASLITGIAAFLYTMYLGIDLAIAWGVISFILNFIPYFGSVVAVVFPVLFSAVQFESWQVPIALFGGLYMIKFLIGNYFEPIVASKAFSVSPFVMLVAFFFWSFLWGIPGAFIGLPITIAMITIFEHHASTRWILRLLST
ncbi:MAG: AI-2E family transporter [Methylacidiphilales bacterium]|nr:AI-2E family transporter [Candidatus Methylacidiphilales bacterium]